MTIPRRAFLAGTAATALASRTKSVAAAAPFAGIGASAGAAGASREVDVDAIPSADEIYDWIATVFEQGIRRPGYPADDWAIDWIVERFSEFGLENVRTEPIPAVRWEPLEWSLDITTAAGETRTVECFPMPFTPPVDGLDVELAAWDPQDRTAVSGRACLFDNGLLRVPPAVFVGSGSAPEDLAGRVYDPEGTFEGTEHVLPFGAALQGVVEPFAAEGAVAVVGVLSGYPGNSVEYYVPYTGEQYSVPGVWVNGPDGAWLTEQLAAGTVRVLLTVRSSREDITSANVVGELPGADDDIVVIGSHHDGPWASAVEDGSGISLVLAQARFWAAQPVERRPHRMMFLLQGGHMSGGSGIDAFLETHEAELERYVLEVHLEHACLDFVEQDSELVSAGQCVPRWWFVSRIPPLEAAVIDALAAENLTRSTVLAPDAIGDAPPTDGQGFFRVGVPSVSFLSAPFYLFDSIDTLDKIDRENLVPITKAAIRILDSTAGVTADAMRAAHV
jgi:hypothetical protein